MKNFFVLGCFALLAVQVVAGCNNGNKTTPAAAPAPASTSTGAPATGKIAYVNIDSLEAKYELLKAKREDFKKRQEQMESELQRSYMSWQADVQEMEKKARANQLTQGEAEAAQQRLGQMQQTLQSRKESLTDQLMKEQEEFNKDLKKRLDAFLEDYNKNHSYDYILSYSSSASPILWANKALDITNDVVNGMNTAAKNDEGKKK